jgi:hypothetical protein
LFSDVRSRTCVRLIDSITTKVFAKDNSSSTSSSSSSTSSSSSSSSSSSAAKDIREREKVKATQRYISTMAVDDLSNPAWLVCPSFPLLISPLFCVSGFILSLFFFGF